MDSITVRCQMCKHKMKFPAEKAGKRAKCKKCESIVDIEAAAQPEPAPEPPKPAVQEDDDGDGAYGVYVDPEILARQKALAEEEERRATRKVKKNLPKVTRKVKAINEADSWARVRTGMLLMLAGTVFWLFAHLLQGTYVLVGSAEFPAFGEMMKEKMDDLRKRDQGALPEPGRAWDLNWRDIYLEMIAGKNFVTFAKVCLTFASVLYFFQALCWTIGYFFYLQVPRRFGMFGQTLTMLALAFFNFFFMLVFKFLPVVGVFNYTLIPFVVPEIALTDYNADRMVPIHVLWSAAPFWENLLTLTMRFTLYFEPAFACIFLWSAGMAIKDNGVAKSGRGAVEICLGTLFVLICFQLLSLCGASPILITVLRVIYGLWFFFLILFLIQYCLALVKARAVLDEKINPKNELKDKKKSKDDEDDDDEDEDDED